MNATLLSRTIGLDSVRIRDSMRERSHKKEVLSVPTIHDIAERAGVSKSTVSRVVSNTGYVGPQTRERVNRAIEELGYTPNLIARGMRTNKSTTIGLFIPDVSNPFYSELFKGIEAVTREAGYSTLVCHTSMDQKAERYYINELLKRRIDGVIICTYHRDPASRRYFRELSHSKPVVFMDPVLDDQDCSYVVSDGFSGTRKAVAHLAGRGCRRIAYIQGLARHAVTETRLKGYLKGIADQGAEVDQRLIFDGDFSHQTGRDAVRHFLSLEEPPDGIMSATDVMAIGALKELAVAGIPVPRQVKVIGFDNIPLSELTQPSLTTIAQPILDLGSQAAELLLKRIRNPKTPNQQIVMQCTLVERESA